MLLSPILLLVLLLKIAKIESTISEVEKNSQQPEQIRIRLLKQIDAIIQQKRVLSNKRNQILRSIDDTQALIDQYQAKLLVERTKVIYYYRQLYVQREECQKFKTRKMIDKTIQNNESSCLQFPLTGQAYEVSKYYNTLQSNNALKDIAQQIYQLQNSYTQDASAAYNNVEELFQFLKWKESKNGQRIVTECSRNGNTASNISQESGQCTRLKSDLKQIENLLIKIREWSSMASNLLNQQRRQLNNAKNALQDATKSAVHSTTQIVINQSALKQKFQECSKALQEKKLSFENALKSANKIAEDIKQKKENVGNSFAQLGQIRSQREKKTEKLTQLVNLLQKSVNPK